MLYLFNVSYVKLKDRIYTNSNKLSSVFMSHSQGNKILIHMNLRRLPLYMLESACYLYGKYQGDRKYFIPWIAQIMYGFLAHQMKLMLSLVQENVRRPTTITIVVILQIIFIVIQQVQLFRGTLNARLRIRPRIILDIDKE
ncbi:hypothetical protein M8J76_017268 [Diaphorina citri]|nr:hypothetical protein M8J76_017268 [Diaphorina citri]